MAAELRHSINFKRTVKKKCVSIDFLIHNTIIVEGSARLEIEKQKNALPGNVLVI